MRARQTFQGKWWGWFAWMFWLSMGSCSRDQNSPKLQEWHLLQGENLKRWTQAEFLEAGEAMINAGELELGEGEPLTGMVVKNWKATGLPLVDYSIEYEALRVKGSDFFGTVTFPVEEENQCVSFVLGGWGGEQTGISSIDQLDASTNETAGVMKFESGQWYRVKIEVKKGLLQVWVDGVPVVHLLTKGRMLGLRTGMEPCAPFGFASYATQGKIRQVQIKKLLPENGFSGW